MALYDILFHTGTGHAHFLNGGIIIVKPLNSAWTSEELSLGTRATMNFSDSDFNELVPGLIDFKVNDNANPNSHSRGR